MPPHTRFVRDENVERLFAQLEGQPDPEVRAMLHRLLLEELDRCAIPAERLELIDRLLDKVSAHIRVMQRLVEHKADAESAAFATQMILSFMASADLFEAARRRALEAFDQPDA